MKDRACSDSLRALCSPGTHHPPPVSPYFPEWLQIAAFLEKVADSSADAAPLTEGSIIRLAKLSTKLTSVFTLSTIPSDADSIEVAPPTPPTSRRPRDRGVDNHHEMHKSILGQFQEWDFTAVHVPESLFHRPEDLPNNLDGRQQLTTKDGTRTRGSENALVAEQIRLLPPPIHRALVAKLGEATITALAAASGSNADCVARLYLGRKGCGDQAKQPPLEKCRSMNLHQMLKIQMDVEVMARKVAVSMALLHWGAKVDGRGVKFVLGGSCEMTSRPEITLPSSQGTGDLGSSSSSNAGCSSAACQQVTRRTTKLWLIDFHRVRPMTMDNEGLANASRAIWFNEPYFPRPLQSLQIQKKAWNAFVMSYIAASDKILKENNEKYLLELPRSLICRLVHLEKKLGLSRGAE
ncbi:hypothetical protein TgHK011_004889 [Trichoderma gracile]|nr:hypothetical protein TgHK011_004889 [Trichoderma gracile]